MAVAAGLTGNVVASDDRTPIGVISTLDLVGSLADCLEGREAGELPDGR